MAGLNPASIFESARPRVVLRRHWPLLLWTAALLLVVAILQVGARDGWPASANYVLLALALLLTGALHLGLHMLAQASAQLQGQRVEVSAVLHDLRAPLLTARSYLDLLVSEAFGPLSEEARDAATRAAVAAERAQSLTSELASWRADAPLTLARVELEPLLRDVVASLSGELTSLGATIEVDALPAVRGDREALYRVFANLIENALKYRKAELSAPRVVISATRDGAKCRIAVRDSGIGIAASDRERVFEPRTRGLNVGSLPGAGLGLATVRRLVRAHGGDVSIDAEVSDGTCIEVLLPAA